jgi:hypothetical protein
MGGKLYSTLSGMVGPVLVQTGAVDLLIHDTIIESENFRLSLTIIFHRLKNRIRSEGEGEGEERNAG